MLSAVTMLSMSMITSGQMEIFALMFLTVTSMRMVKLETLPLVHRESKKSVYCHYYCLGAEQRVKPMMDGSKPSHHVGHHNHYKPPVTKPALEAIEELVGIVIANPEVQPAKLQTGCPNRPSVSAVDDAVLDQDLLAYCRSGKTDPTTRN